tara:strand:- start:767 stop:892 length:126 start_codon:yes stop_codon:yes gene_type:complete
MNIQVTIAALLLFVVWIAVAFALAQRRLKNAYSKYQIEERK